MKNVNTLDFKLEPSPTHPFKVTGCFMRGVKTTRFYVHLVDAQAAQKECFDGATLESPSQPELFHRYAVPAGHYHCKVGADGYVVSVIVQVRIAGTLHARTVDFLPVLATEHTDVEVKLGLVMSPKGEQL